MKLFSLFASTLLASSTLQAQEAPAPAPAPAPAITGTELIDNIMPHLIKANGEKVAIDLKQKKHVLIYWSASWCGPCRQFTPKLVEFYKQHGGGDTFEIVLIGLDKTEDKMAQYIKSHNMPWPAVAFDQKKGTGAKSFAKGGIPRLMIIDQKGEVLACGNAFSVLPQFKKIIGVAP